VSGAAVDVDARLREYEQQVRDYQRSWWRADVDAQSHLASRPRLASELENRAVVHTSDIYLHPSTGSWDGGRPDLHLRLARTQAGIGPRPEAPAVYFTIGEMGAGKTTVLRGIVEAHRRLLARDGTLSQVAADAVRAALPEYAGGLGSRVVHLEALAATYEVVYPVVRDDRHDLVYDTIGRFESDGQVTFAAQLTGLVEAGYRAHLLLAVAPLEERIRRTRKRAVTGPDRRLVDEAIQRQQDGEPRKVRDKLVRDGLISSWAEIDTSGPPAEWTMESGTNDWLDVRRELLDLMET
jgi:hypothetical protein